MGSPEKLGLLNILGSPEKLGLLNILGSPEKLGLLNILGSPGLRESLDQISVLSIPIDGGWEAFFADGQPVQSKSLLDALETGKPIPLLGVDIAQTPFAHVSLFSFFLGQMPLRNLADAATEARWCTALEPLDDAFIATGGTDAADCGAARFAAPSRSGGTLSASLIELQLQGVSLTLLPELAELSVNSVVWDFDATSGNEVDTPFEATLLSNVDLAASDLGSLTMDQVGAAVGAIVNCAAASGVCDPNETLAFAQDQGAIRPDAVLQKLLPAIGDYNVLLALMGLLPPQVRPLQALDPESEVFAAVAEPDVDDVDYHVEFSPVGVANAREATISVALPAGFVPVFNSAGVSIDGAQPPVWVPMKSNGRTMRAAPRGRHDPRRQHGRTLVLSAPWTAAVRRSPRFGERHRTWRRAVDRQPGRHRHHGALRAGKQCRRDIAGARARHDVSDARRRTRRRRLLQTAHERRRPRANPARPAVARRHRGERRSRPRRLRPARRGDRSATRNRRWQRSDRARVRQPEPLG